MEGKAIQWLRGFPANAFPDYNTLKEAFLGRFRKEKTPNELLRKIRKVTQKKLKVEDYAQEFKTIVGRLAPNERPTEEMMVGYFMRGLRKELRHAVAGFDVAGGFDGLVELAIRVENRLMLTKGKGSDTDLDSEDESEDDTESDSDSEDDSDLDSKKKNKTKGKSQKTKKKSQTNGNKKNGKSDKRNAKKEGSSEMSAILEQL